MAHLSPSIPPLPLPTGPTFCRVPPPIAVSLLVALAHLSVPPSPSRVPLLCVEQHRAVTLLLAHRGREASQAPHQHFKMSQLHLPFSVPFLSPEHAHVTSLQALLSHTELR
jgi:hypothetical protein